MDTAPCCRESDEALVLRYQHSGARDALDEVTERYKSFVRSKAHAYFLIGADREDLIQEGMIGFFKAIRDYRVERAASFRAFAELCITRQILSAIKAATRQKHIPLNSYVSLDHPLFADTSAHTLLDVLATDAPQNPEDLLLRREERQLLSETLRTKLSPLEQAVLHLYLQGRSYREIALLLHRRPKTVDNALQRIKHKVEKFLAAY